MKYIVRTFGLGCDEVECSNYDRACELASKVRKSGYDAAIIDACASYIHWCVTGVGVEQRRVLARSAEEALYKVQFAAGSVAYNEVQADGNIEVIVTRPNGTKDTIDCICYDEALKYIHRYTNRGWAARISTY